MGKGIWWYLDLFLYIESFYLRNYESFFEYDKVIKYGPGWSNPIKPEVIYDRFDHTNRIWSPHNIKRKFPYYLYLYNFQQL